MSIKFFESLQKFFFILFLTTTSTWAAPPKPDRILMNDETANNPAIQALLQPGKNGYTLNITDSLYDVPICRDFLNVLNNAPKEEIKKSTDIRQYNFTDTDFSYVQGRKATWKEASSFAKSFYLLDSYNPKEFAKNIKTGRDMFELADVTFWGTRSFSR